MARHVLSLGHVVDEDYGNYSCVATNSVGSDRCVPRPASCLKHFLSYMMLTRAYMELHGRPSTPVFPDSSPGDSNFLAWRVASPAPVDQYRLLFRQVQYQPRYQDQTC